MALINRGLEKLGISYEDTFVIDTGNNAFEESTMSYRGAQSSLAEKGMDKFAPQRIVITCKNKKRRVSGVLSQSIKISGISEWQPMMGGGIMALSGSVLQTVSNMDQLALGASIQQPWMNRKYWKSTQPFNLQFSMSLIAESDAKSEVFDPAVALLSFTYPRQSDKSLLDVTNSTLSNLGDKLDRTLAIGESSMFGSLLNSISNYHIPGPSLSYSGVSSGQDSGDAVTLTIGSAFAFGGVYLEKVDVEFSQSFSSDGFPLACKIDISATSMDSNYCDSNGDFLVSRFRTSQAEISNSLDAIKSGTAEIADSVLNLGSSVIGFYKNVAGNIANKI